MKNFAIIINSEEIQRIQTKQKNENPKKVLVYKAVYNVLSSAVDHGEVLGVAVGEWSDIDFLQGGTQVRLSIQHLARQGDKRNNAVITVLLQGAFGNFEHLAHLLGSVVTLAIHLRFVVCEHRTNVVTQCAQLIEHSRQFVSCTSSIAITH